MASADKNIPLFPPALFPIEAATSTGSAPGVIFATITSLSIFSFVSIPVSTISSSIMGIMALPPPNPIHPIFNIEVNSCNLLLIIHDYSSIYFLSLSIIVFTQSSIFFPLVSISTSGVSGIS